jgi:hypothetical protein
MKNVSSASGVAMVEEVDALSGLSLCRFGYNSEMEPLNADSILSFADNSVTNVRRQDYKALAYAFLVVKRSICLSYLGLER